MMSLTFFSKWLTKSSAEREGGGGGLKMGEGVEVSQGWRQRLGI
jgi:hypothetical protein